MRYTRALTALSPVIGWAYRRARAIPLVERGIEHMYGELLGKVASHLDPYAGKTPAYTSLPSRGAPAESILSDMRALAEQENERWRAGYMSGGVYHGEPEHAQLMADVYALYAQCNPLHPDVWPSAVKYESEVVHMTAGLLGAGTATRGAGSRICGTITSGGTESILLAMKAYRDRAHDRHGITAPEIVTPSSAHAAFDKAAEYFGIRRVTVPVGSDLRADVAAMRRAITKNTVALVASAPGFPHGVIDPVPELAQLAQEHRIGLHVDACLGAFVLPFARELGYAVPPFDFAVAGVTSMSADTHKYGYAAKGTSVVLYRDPSLRRYQYFVSTEWPGGLYVSPTLAGSRPGALSAAAWAALVHMGRDGYLDATRRILGAAAQLRAGIERIPGLRVLGDPLWILAFTADGFDIYRVLDAMSHRGWSLNGLQHPACLHLCVTLRHTLPGVVERFLADLAQSADEARTARGSKPGLAPLYGLAANIPLRGPIGDLLRRYADLLHR